MGARAFLDLDYFDFLLFFGNFDDLDDFSFGFFFLFWLLNLGLGSIYIFCDCFNDIFFDIFSFLLNFLLLLVLFLLIFEHLCHLLLKFLIISENIVRLDIFLNDRLDIIFIFPELGCHLFTEKINILFMSFLLANIVKFAVFSN